MSKVITFSRAFPSYHPKKGEPTFFVEKFWNAIDFPKRKSGNFFIKCNEINESVLDTPTKKLKLYDSINSSVSEIKNHTIRKGKRFKKNDYFSPRVWGDDVNPKSGRAGAYHSKQIILAPDTLITDVWDFEIDKDANILINNKIVYSFCEEHNKILNKVALNDGLTADDLLAWFKYPKPFSGQVICWNSKTKY